MVRRDDAELPFVEGGSLAGPPLLLDTGVYIHQMSGRAPPIIEQLIAVRIVNHSTVTIQELANSIGHLAPTDPRTPPTISAIRTVLEGMSAHRTFQPDVETLARASILAGKMARLLGLVPAERRKVMNDATLFLQAYKLGFTFLSANIADCDRLLRFVPEARVLLYRQA